MAVPTRVAASPPPPAPRPACSELDRQRGRSGLAFGARRALARLAALRAERDTWVHLQSAAEHRRVARSAEATAGADDLILHTAMLYRATYVQVWQGGLAGQWALHACSSRAAHAPPTAGCLPRCDVAGGAQGGAGV